jgi:hypothetical protein
LEDRRLSIGTVFLWSSLRKLQGTDYFISSIAGYELLPAQLVRPGAIAVISLELLIGLSHVTGLGLPVVLPFSIVLLLGFVTAVTLTIKRGLIVPCACFGPSDQNVSARSIARLAVLLAGEGMLAVVALTKHSALLQSMHLFPARDIPIALTGVALLMGVVASILSIPDAVAMRRMCQRLTQMPHHAA